MIAIVSSDKYYYRLIQVDNTDRDLIMAYDSNALTHQGRSLDERITEIHWLPRTKGEYTSITSYLEGNTEHLIGYLAEHELPFILEDHYPELLI